MSRYIAAFALAFTLFFGLAIPAYASSETTSATYTFSWSAVLSKAIGGLAIVAPAIVFMNLNNRKDK